MTKLDKSSSNASSDFSLTPKNFFKVLKGSLGVHGDYFY